MRLTLTSFVTLDGVVQGPGGPDEDRSGGFEHGGWVVPYVDDDMGKAMAGFFAEADAFLLGRRTYEIFATSWPEYRLLTYPVVLGEGKRLFADGAKPAALNIIDHKTTSTGVSIDVYAAAGEPTFGSIGPEYDDDEHQ